MVAKYAPDQLEKILDLLKPPRPSKLPTFFQRATEYQVAEHVPKTLIRRSFSIQDPMLSLLMLYLIKRNYTGEHQDSLEKLILDVGKIKNASDVAAKIDSVTSPGAPLSIDHAGSLSTALQLLAEQVRCGEIETEPILSGLTGGQAPTAIK